MWRYGVDPTSACYHTDFLHCSFRSLLSTASNFEVYGRKK